MLIPLNQLIKKYTLIITGVVHVGGHYGEEEQDYISAGIQKRTYFEPDPDTFKILTERVKEGAECICCALGATNTVAMLNVETFNSGQSSSLLKPGTHLKDYPLITFDTQKEVLVRRMDEFNLSGLNFLNMDTQGYELEVLKGADLSGIDYIYTEVNTDEVYIGCGKMSEIDAFLIDFIRVETVLTGQGWGDAFYIRKPGERVDVPLEFRPHHPMQYPIDNDQIFEEWFYTQPIQNTDRVYLPIFWTSYYCKHKYGKDYRAIQLLQMFLETLDRSRKYFTIVQFDDGILNDLTGLDIKVYAMSGNRIDYPLPLICKPHKYPQMPKDIFCSYIGANNHHIRTGLMQYQNKTSWYINDRPHTLEYFCEILARSKYVLCPRGYGQTSFRIMEALQYGAIPVYISDQFILPHYDFSYGIQVQNPGPELPGMLEESEPLITTPAYEAFDKYFTYEANKNIIYKTLKDERTS